MKGDANLEIQEREIEFVSYKYDVNKHKIHISFTYKDYPFELFILFESKKSDKINSLFVGHLNKRKACPCCGNCGNNFFCVTFEKNVLKLVNLILVHPDFRFHTMRLKKLWTKFKKSEIGVNYVD